MKKSGNVDEEEEEHGDGEGEGIQSSSPDAWISAELVEEDMFIDLPEINPEGTLHEPTDGIWCGMLTQEGFYNTDKEHTNQDAMAVEIQYQQVSGQHLFMVLDGHGPNGHHVAQFVQKQMPYIIDNVASKSAKKDQVEILKQSYEIVNTMLRNEPFIDDSLSGTTCVTAWFQDSYVYLANAGDSRAVLGTANLKGDAVAMELTHDQTPFRADERARVIKAGARIMTSGEKDGDAFYNSTDEYTADDPPRCYLQKYDYPGTAFTRSIGDGIAERIGVVSTPEVLMHKLTDADRFLILASDGVWEFISSQEAVDLVATCDNPYDAAHKLIEKAWKLWLQFDTRTDDISVMVIFSHVKENDKSNSCAAVGRTPHTQYR